MANGEDSFDKKEFKAFSLLIKSLGFKTEDIKYFVARAMVSKGLEYTADIKKDSKTIENYFKQNGKNINIDEMVFKVSEE